MPRPGFRYALSSEVEEAVLDLVENYGAQCKAGVTTFVTEYNQAVQLRENGVGIVSFRFQVPARYAYRSPEAVFAVLLDYNFWTYFWLAFEYHAAN